MIHSNTAARASGRIAQRTCATNSHVIVALKLSALTDARRAALRERIRAALPIQPDGSIQLSARAWAVRGVVAHADNAQGSERATV